MSYENGGSQRFCFWTRRKCVWAAAVAVLCGLPSAWFGIGYYLKNRDIGGYYAVVVVSKGSEANVLLNGQPLTSGGDYRGLVTPYVIDGWNTVQIDARPVGDAEGRDPCTVRFSMVRFGAMQGSTFDGGWSDPLSPIKGFGSFTARVPVRWVWQDADDLTTLTDTDRSQILSVLEQIEDALRSKDWPALRQMCLSLSQEPSAPQFVFDHEGTTVWDTMATAETALSGIEDYTVSVLPRNDIAMDQGSKVVRLHPKRCDQEWVISAGRAAGIIASAGERSTIVGFKELRFVRMDGRWHWIHF